MPLENMNEWDPDELNDGSEGSWIMHMRATGKVATVDMIDDDTVEFTLINSEGETYVKTVDAALLDRIGYFKEHDDFDDELPESETRPPSEAELRLAEFQRTLRRVTMGRAATRARLDQYPSQV